jgi:hypothetical protein
MKLAPTLLTTLLLSVGVAACAGGGEGHETSSKSPTTTATARPTTTVASVPLTSAPPAHRPGVNDSYDGDDHNPRNGFLSENNDDWEVERFGQAASPAEVESAERFVGEYFSAAVSGDGAKACALLIPSLAGGIGGSYEKRGDAVYLHGKTCAEVMAKLFTHEHKGIVKQAHGLRVTAVRELRGSGRVLFESAGMRERHYMALTRYGSDWKFNALLDSPYP